MDQRQDLIDIFLDMNAQLNLSAIRDAEGVYVKHILDSLELTKIVDLTQCKSLCDVWTGGGFPLLALAKEYNKNDIVFTGIDARRKKVDAINEMINALKLLNCRAIRSRIEDHTSRYDVVTARAVAYADKIIPRCVPLCKPWGKICLYKQVDDVEKEEILRQCQKYKLSLLQEHRYKLFDGDIERVIYVLKSKE